MKAPAAVWRVPMTEADLSRAVLDMARLFGWMGYHTWSSVHSRAGFVDWVFVRPPRVLMVELKAEKGKLTQEQVEWIFALGRCPGVETFVWRPTDLDDGTIEAILR